MTDTLRDRIARIIDYDCFEQPDPEYRHQALSKADQIIALFDESGWVCLPEEIRESFAAIQDRQERIRADAKETSDFIRNAGRTTVKKFRLSDYDAKAPAPEVDRG